jgi:large subunit ribosomal protein L4
MADSKQAEAISAPVVTQTKGSAGSIDLPGSIFGEPLRRGLLADVVRMQTAGRRAGTSATKTRAEVSGGGKKPWKQKGTGRARAGSTRSPVWPGGAIIFGPQPRDYSYPMPKQARRTALRSVLAQKLREERLTIVDKIEFAEMKTKSFVAMLGALGIDDSVLVVIDDADAKVELAGRNVPNAKVLRVAGLNVYDLLRYHHLVVTKAALERIKERVAA